MARLEKVNTWMITWLPMNRRQIHNCTLPNIPGANTAANKPWQIQKMLDHMTPFHTEDLALTQAVVDNLDNRAFMDDPDYADAFFSKVQVTVWVENNVVLESD